MVDAPDKEALLEKNPGVDRTILEENERKIAEAQRDVRVRRQRGPALPYGGRRLVVDERAAADEGGDTRLRPRHRTVIAPD